MLLPLKIKLSSIHSDFSCPSVCDGCGRGNSLKLLLLGHSELTATRGMPSWALAVALATDKNTRSFAMLNQKEIRFSLTCRRGRGSHRQDERLAWVASRGQGTSCSSSFVSKVLGANYKRANNFLPVAHKFTMCTDRKQPLNLPVMRMRVWIRLLLLLFNLLLRRVSQDGQERITETSANNKKGSGSME